MAGIGPILTPPGGTTTQLQYNNGGFFDGTAGLTWDGTNLNFATSQASYYRSANNKIWSSATDTLDITAPTLLNLGAVGGDIGLGDNATLIALKPLFDQWVDLASSSLRFRNLYIGNDIDILDGGNLVIGSSVGSIIGQAASLLAFFDGVPRAKYGAFTQTYSTASTTVPTNTSNSVSTTAATNSSPWGYTTQAQADNLITSHNALRTDVDNVRKVCNEIINRFKNSGGFGLWA